MYNKVCVCERMCGDGVAIPVWVRKKMWVCARTHTGTHAVGEVFMYVMCMLKSVAVKSVCLSLCEYMPKACMCVYEDLGEGCIFKCVCEFMD